MTIELRVISLGALATHPLRNERGDQRPAHMTTTLITADDKQIIVDPSLPPRVMADRLGERAGLAVDDITDVFLTTFRPMGRRGLAAFPEARWMTSLREREAVGVSLVESFQEAEAAGDEDLAATLREEVQLLQRCEVAPDSLADGIDLFPLPGVTPGLCGLLVAQSFGTTIIASDAVQSMEHLAAGQVDQAAQDIEAAQESMREVIEIADFVIPGRDGLVPNPLRRW